VCLAAAAAFGSSAHTLPHTHVHTRVCCLLPPARLPAPRDKVFLEHVFSSTAILSYILFWMIFYNLCHVF
jgi:hypothetical protein